MEENANTIDSFQGSEKEIIIFSCVRTDALGFMKEKRRVNVALTRAKYGMIIVGNYNCLRNDNRWLKLFTDLRADEQILDGVDQFHRYIK
jgi:superfamily I DNA and/or RNA helicase